MTGGFPEAGSVTGIRENGLIPDWGIWVNGAVRGVPPPTAPFTQMRIPVRSPDPVKNKSSF
ncbi:hypothetical protein [Deinococcus hopiensis]|uniref:hypothetical protein n=1 Tax=Deinococcus hopiensis TaxID=309885 RepID=UPI000A068925|nr:hypothetical protein [Deinococcus hopiensis]